MNGTKTIRAVARFLGAAVASLILGAAAVAIGIMLASRASDGIGPKGKFFTVGKGETVQRVAKSLESKGLIRSAITFRALSKISGDDSDLKAGTYRIEPGMDSMKILEEFVSGKQALCKVTVPEGYTLGQIARLLEELDVVKGADFLKAATSKPLLEKLGIPADSAEGYLYPDTYFFPADYTSEPIVEAMVATFRERVAAIPEAAALSPAELHDRIILASIVEREYKDPAEAPLMASVFYNRIRIRMALQSCATVVYVITERLGKPHPEVIYDRDLKLKDPYNTYEHRGLPPGPISNPGMTSLRAVFYPAATHYLYFRLINGETGNHHFSATLEEHIDSRTLYIKRIGV